jgi:hypothetical protein
MFDPTVSGPPSKHERFRFYKIGLGVKDKKSTPIGPVKSLRSLMNLAGLKRVDLMKVDIEGAEWAVFDALDKENYWPFDQLLIELHFVNLAKTLGFFFGLENAGFRVFSRETNFNPCAQKRLPTAIEFGLVRKNGIFDRAQKSTSVPPIIRESSDLQIGNSSGIGPYVFVVLTRKIGAARLCTMLQSLSQVLNRNRYPIIVLFEHTGERDDEEMRMILDCAGAAVFFERVTLPKPPLPKIPEKSCSWRQGYKSMCHFFSQELYSLPILEGVEFIARLDDDSKFSGEPFDPFHYMEQNQLEYGYRLIVGHDSCTNGLLKNVEIYAKWQELKLDWQQVKIPAVFYNNFFIARREIFLRPGYQHFIAYLDALKGFWTDRWGDAPVHTSAAALFGWKRFHFTTEFGYCHKC